MVSQLFIKHLEMVSSQGDVASTFWPKAMWFQVENQKPPNHTGAPQSCIVKFHDNAEEVTDIIVHRKLSKIVACREERKR